MAAKVQRTVACCRHIFSGHCAAQTPKSGQSFTVHIDKVKPYLGDTPKSWLTEGPKEEAVERTDQTEQAERLSGTEGDAPMVNAEEQTAEETTPKGRDSSEKNWIV